MYHKGHIAPQGRGGTACRARSPKGPERFFPGGMPPQMGVFPSDSIEAGPPALQEGHLHVWRACLDVEPTTRRRYSESLSHDECERAARFYFEKHRRRFSAGRGLLRSLLGKYLALPPDEIIFSYNEHGKPHLTPDQNQSDLRFNLSHSDELALFAFTMGRDIGVDVERIRPDRSTRGIAESFFAPREVAALFALSNDQHTAAFFRCWTRKEAYIKAKGTGMSIPLDSFAVSLAPDAPAELLWVRDKPEEPSRWTLTTLSPDPAFAACAAIEGEPTMVRCAEARS